MTSILAKIGFQIDFIVVRTMYGYAHVIVEGKFMLHVCTTIPSTATSAIEGRVTENYKWIESYILLTLCW